MAVIGINCSGFHSSAALFVDGNLSHAICEERLSRVKNDKSFPLRAIQYCCEAAGLTFADLTHAFIGWHPRFYIRQSDRVLNDAMQNRGKISFLALNELASLSPSIPEDLSHKLKMSDSSLEIHFVDHHRAHAAGGFFQSGFEQADLLVLDGFGENTCGLAGKIDRSGIDALDSHATPHSLGLLYAAFTEFLGFRPYGDEWKVMALSALGDSERYYPLIRSLVKTQELNVELDLSYFEFFMFYTPHLYSRKLSDALGTPTPQGAESSQRDWDIMAAVQRVVEETVFELLKNLHARSGGSNLVLGGGFFMNSVLNGKIHQNTPYKDIFLGGSPDDSGICLGSGFYGLNYMLGQQTTSARRQDNYFGRPYSDSEIKSELERRKLRYSPVENISQQVAQELREGKIVALFQGRSEFGQRALGSRSILADPTRSDMKDLVNATVKYREGFRPFAPAVLEGHQAEVFEDSGLTSYFMERVFQYRPSWTDRVPAVVHFDGSGRLQTVSRKNNPIFFDTITEFEKLSGVPLVLNTSFNVNGMPLVESPGDAIDCFYQSGIDVLMLGPYQLEK